MLDPARTLRRKRRFLAASVLVTAYHRMCQQKTQSDLRITDLIAKGAPRLHFSRCLVAVAKELAEAGGLSIDIINVLRKISNLRRFGPGPYHPQYLQEEPEAK